MHNDDVLTTTSYISKYGLAMPDRNKQEEGLERQEHHCKRGTGADVTNM
jgi:hypothetical protein